MPELTTAALETTFDPENDYLWFADVSETPDAINRALLKYFRHEALYIPCGDETTNLTAAAGKAYFYMPFAMTLTDVRCSVNTAPVGSTIIVDINEGAGAGTSILSTKLTIDDGEFSSVDAATPAVISDTALANNARISIDIDQIGSGTAGKGLKVWLIGYRA
jgi:hypothetical protein